MEKLWNQFLSDLVVEYHKLQTFHWYVKDVTFFQTHAKLEEYYDGVNAQSDEVAEVMLMRGMKPKATLKDFLATSKIKEAKAAYVTTPAVFKEVLKDFEYLLDSAVTLKAKADAKNDYLLSAKVDGFIENYSKAIWMLKQSNVK